MKVVLIAPLSAERQAEIAAVDDRLEIVDAWELFGPELVADWPQQTADSYLPRLRPQLPADKTQDGRLAAAAPAHDGDDLAARNRHRDALEHRAHVIAEGDVDELDRDRLGIDPPGGNRFCGAGRCRLRRG